MDVCSLLPSGPPHLTTCACLLSPPGCCRWPCAAGSRPVTPLSSAPGHGRLHWTLDVLASPPQQAENAWKVTGTAPALAPQGGAPFLPTVASQRGVRRRKNFLPKLPVLLVPLLTARGPVRLDTSQLMGAPALQSWPLPEPLLFVPASIRLPLPATPTPAPPGHHRPPHCTILPLARSRAAAHLCTVPARLLGAPCRAPPGDSPGEGGAALPILKSRGQRR